MSNFQFVKVSYETLNARQKEIYNFQLLSAKLALVGYQALLLSDDWNGADLIALKFGTPETIRIQLKSRFGIYQKYVGQDILIAFRDDQAWYLYPHDDVCDELLYQSNKLSSSASWSLGGSYTWKSLSKNYKLLLERYRLPD